MLAGASAESPVGGEDASAAQVGTERPRAYNVTQLDEAIHASNHFVQCLLNLGMGTSQKLDPGAFFSYPASAPSATSCPHRPGASCVASFR